MAQSIRQSGTDAHALLLGIGRPVTAKAEVAGQAAPAKANVKNLGVEWNVAVGRALARAIAIVGWSQKEAAAKVGVGEAEFSKWLIGARRAHLDRVLAVEELRRPFLVAVVGLTERVEITIRIPMRPAVGA